MAIATINPATGQTVQTFIAHSQVEVNAKLDLAQETFRSFRALTFAQRGQWLRRAADILEQRQEEWAVLMTLEMGKPVQQAIAEVKKCALVCRFYADQAEGFLADEVVVTDASRSFIDGWECGLAQTRFQCPSMCPGDRRNFPNCRISRGSVSNPIDWRQSGQ